MTDRSRWFFKAILSLAIIALVVGSLLPPQGVPKQQINDKMLHFTAYAIAGLLVSFAFRQTSQQVRCLVLLTFMGVLLEFCQTMIPGRAFEVWDMAANGCGSFAAFAALRIVPSA